MSDHSPSPGDDQAPPALSTARMIEAVDRLIEVISAENQALAGGLPVPAAAEIPLKLTLTADLGRAMRHMSETGQLRAERHSPERALLMERAQRLEAVVAENMARLDGAIRATRHRVDAVMAALRDHVARDRVYGKDARSTALRTGSAVGRGFTI
ncbi:hypothetical protein C2U72_15745 [Prosthecomicrobium hirschii]|uniref:hypothetical protein n=1 Tax=Prosthecodimorpha hirschii TaxID=665126 RepID=UPI00112EBD01|nr:hypothetical protein [Prosthecomicrobium hirschii]TPQ49976.1 hypothetical protein C2U72_15745 [Prosthecomicrobium hirschii]